MRMNPPMQTIGPSQALRVFGVRLIGFDAGTLRKLALTVFALLLSIAAASLFRAIARALTRGDHRRHARFLSQQLISLVTTLLFIIIFISIWLDDPSRFASAAALITAGLAVALQKLVMAVVGYFAILRGRTFRVGERISMGGVRGDVIALSYIRTTIMEMGQPDAIQDDAQPAMWVSSWQYTGRIVSVTNDKIFDEPVYNFTREFPYLFEEMKVPVRYAADHARAERILLDAAQRHTVPASELGEEHLHALARRYMIRPTEAGPRVYYRMTDNWLELTVRFLVRDHGIRDVKDLMSREIVTRFREAGIDVASATFELSAAPPLRIERTHEIESR
jgi:small-conductance mechanosensitive channel